MSGTMLKAIFYARFHEEKGPTVLHQVPEGSVIPLSNTTQQPLFHFPSISNHIIPRREFCDRPLSLLASHHRIIGFPVCIHNPVLYPRSDFIFNFCLVVDEKAEWGAYASVVSKLARLMRNLEEQAGWLSKEERREGWVKAGERGYGGGNRVFAICEMVLEDLNCYCECMIPIDDSNTLNLKLFPTRSPPPPIQIYHVPLSTVRFSSLQTNTWDLTVQRIIPFIDGINSVQKIAVLADTDLTLTRRALAHLLYYGCILMLNTFHFGAIYAATAEIGVFVEDTKMQDECRRYIVTPHSPFKNSIIGSSSSATNQNQHQNTTNTSNQSSSFANLSSSFAASKYHKSSNLNPSTSGPTSPQPPSRATVLHLYSSLRQGLPLRDWCLAHASSLAYIDVRRFITFGIIKGFLYRSHRYAIALRAADTAADAAVAEEALRNKREAEKTWRKAAMSSGWRTPVALQDEPALDGGFGGVVVRAKNEFEVQEEEGKGKGEEGKMPGVEELGKGRSLADQYLARYLDGCHCLDEVCTDTGMGQQEAVRKLRGLGDVVFVNR
ncbi:nitrogen permease regulator 2 [Aureobasidium pullulans EXF-150]|uniref:Nitrogen permease regulator 2 n=2 Tax=Aureobasidium pullulans TaxID=5580 RepID=A0A074Y2U5_AURPU|nr:nitrogen permease regulator 2 [Aureobasidium pullulans EXF-150]KEQ88522.1 nitrogen permease regulator 2 [Aureobasidium pullulans EXF-150]THY34735.1 nitrogen permease regulator 2 [Aureobasidium pullulans]